VGFFRGEDQCGSSKGRGKFPGKKEKGKGWRPIEKVWGGGGGVGGGRESIVGLHGERTTKRTGEEGGD